MAVSRQVKRRIGIACIVLGVAVVIVGVWKLLPDILSQNDFRNFAEDVKRDPDGDPDDKGDGNGQDDGDGPSDEVPYDIDWDEVWRQNEDARAWVSVDGTNIDYPVLQGDDNLYYLYHDIWGRESYASVFLDYRADPNGRNCPVFAHTHSQVLNGFGFSEIAEAHNQWRFDELGTVWYSTPEAGALDFTPVAALHVTPDYETVQTFDWSVDDSRVQDEVDAILARHAALGEWNKITVANAPVPFEADRCVRVGNKGGASGVDHWWVLSDAEMEQARERAKDVSWREWVRGMCADATAGRGDAEELILKSNRCVVLACCSWPFDDHRTLLVCVR